MKKSLFLTPLFALALASCSSDAPLGEEDNYSGPLETSYLSVNILAADGQNGMHVKGTRADAPSDGDATDYENGVGIENNVNSVRFYFFDAFGNSVKVSNASGTLQNYLDWSTDITVSDPATGQDEEKNIDKVTNATLIIQTPQGDRLPASVVAVVNPTSELTNATASVTNLEGFNAVVGNFAATTSSTSLVMSNSVYKNADGTTAEAESVEGFIKTSADEAKDSPVSIYVDRVNAKVRLTVDTTGDDLTEVTLTNGQKAYATGVENVTGTPSDDNQIYVQFLGWNVTSDPTKSFAVKNINTAWDNISLFGEDVWNWSSVTRHRSFWAINPTLNYTLENGDYHFGDFEDAQTVKGFVNGVSTTPNYCYIQENAAQSANLASPEYPSQVIIAAQLVNKAGEPLTIAEWATNHYTESDLLTNLANMANVYQITEEGEDDQSKQTIWTKLGADYFEFVPAEEVGQATFTTPGRYYVYLQLKKSAVEDMDLCIGSGNVKSDFVDINSQLLRSITPAKIWESGHTYYYFPIQHLGTTGSNAEFGVVRNHVYACNITSLSGLGTPVFDDDRKIIPEKPNNDINFIAAQIDILTWRLVNQNIGLSWPK